ncbi:MAG: response regulator [Thiobacillus sp.]|uniref:response regulator n=1 Tax=Thiobacillus sp. TaxID=924 RepID=UPI002893E947|nr:response regulator [Thiobacillus sp.]MDT3705540.1 response regulator [Thiobacillus sp.]
MHCDTDSSSNETPLPADVTRESHDSSTLKVFLIEDSALLQELLGNMLSELDGIEYCGCADGEAQALQRLAEAPVDLVIIDIQLKQGSGIGVLAALQAGDQYGEPHKVVLTNYAHATMRQRCERFGMDAFFDKSLDLDQLIDYVIDAAQQKSMH